MCRKELILMRRTGANCREATLGADMADCGHLARIETMGTGRQGKSRPMKTQGHARQRKVERAMGIESTREVDPELENKCFSAMANPACD